MAPSNAIPTPHVTKTHSSIRKAYIQNLTDLLHVCLLRGEFERARRAWGILIQCREVDWKSKWHWGLLFLDSTSPSTLGATQPSTFRSQGGGGREGERWLKSLRVSAKEAEKPAILHALVLHLIKHERYRAALDELETYLSSYPYLKCGPLHTYAGLLSVYLAQPPSARFVASQTAQSSQARPQAGEGSTEDRQRANSEDIYSGLSPPRPSGREQPNASLLRAARGWFMKALELDPRDTVAQEFLRLIDQPQLSDDESDAEEGEGKDAAEHNDSWADTDSDGLSASDGALDEMQVASDPSSF